MYESMSQYLPNISMFFPDGNFELDLVETSLRIEDLQEIPNPIKQQCFDRCRPQVTQNKVIAFFFVLGLHCLTMAQNRKWSSHTWQQTTILLQIKPWAYETIGYKLNSRH